MIPNNLGALPRPYDPRDIKLGSVQAPVKIPAVFMPEYNIVRNYQGQFPTCSAHAASHFKAIQETIESGVPVRFSPRYDWIKIKQSDGLPITTGTNLRAIFKVLSENGALEFGEMDNAVTMPLEQYSDPAAITPEMDAKAHDNIIGSYVFFDPTYETVCPVIFRRKTCILLSVVDEGFWYTQYPTFTAPKYGHFFIATGYDEKYVRVLDSADPDDKNAVKYIRKEDLRYPFFLEAGVGMDLPNWWVRGLTSEVALLRKVAELLILLQGRKQ